MRLVIRRLGNSPRSVAMPDRLCFTHISITATAAYQSDLYLACVGGSPCIIEIVILQRLKGDVAKIDQLMVSSSVYENVTLKSKRESI